MTKIREKEAAFLQIKLSTYVLDSLIYIVHASAL